MKILPLLLLWAAPALAQTPDITAPLVAAPEVKAAQLSPTWEFAPDFRLDQNQIIWRTNSAADGIAFFSATTNAAGVMTGQTIRFVDSSGQPLGSFFIAFDKRGRAQKQQLLDPGGMPTLGIGNSLPLVATTPEDGPMSRQVFTFPGANGATVLTADYDARGRRQRDVLTDNAGATVRTINYVYDAKGLRRIEDGVSRLTIERDANGKMRAMSIVKNGLLTRSATPLRDEKNKVIGTRIEDYSGGILQEVNEITVEGGAKNSRTSQSFSDTTTVENGRQTNKQTFDYRIDVGGTKKPAKPAIEVRKHTTYRNATIATEEIYRAGVLTQRSEFNDNGVIEKLTNFNADGSIATSIDTNKIPYADGTQGIIRR